MKKREAKKRAQEPEDSHEPVQERDHEIEIEDMAAVQTLLQKAQEEAKEQFQSALEKFGEVVQFQGTVKLQVYYLIYFKSASTWDRKWGFSVIVVRAKGL